MKNPTNHFKMRLSAGTQQIGIWNSIPNPGVAELLAVAGFDWIVVDTEHAPTEVTDVLPALQAIAAYPKVSAVVRPAWNDTVLIKRHLDQGAQTLIIPYVQNAQEAAAAVAATRYPPLGVRGVAGLTRATRFGSVEGYTQSAHEEICVIVQVETRTALDNLDAIAGTDGVDGIFIGPADLAASLGHPGDPMHQEVQSTIWDTVARLKDLGKPAGILATTEPFVAASLEHGTSFTAVGLDIGLLGTAARQLRAGLPGA